MKLFGFTISREKETPEPDYTGDSFIVDYLTRARVIDIDPIKLLDMISDVVDAFKRDKGKLPDRALISYDLIAVLSHYYKTLFNSDYSKFLEMDVYCILNKYRHFEIYDVNFNYVETPSIEKDKTE